MRKPHYYLLVYTHKKNELNMKLRLLEALDSRKNYVEVDFRAELLEPGMVIQACNSST